MLSKERVRLAIAHQETDRVPVDYQARAEVSARLRQRLGLDPEASLEEYLGVDLRGVRPTCRVEVDPLRYADPTVEVTPQGIYRDIWGVGFRANQTAIGFYMDLAENPLRDLRDPAALADYPWPTADLWDYGTIAAQAREQSQYWIVAHSRGIFEISWFLRGFDGFMLDLAMFPERANAVMDCVQAYLMARTRRILEAGQGLIDMVEYNDDVGSQKGMLLSPAMWRAHLKPRMAAFIEMCRAYQVKVRYHSCGGIRPIIPDLIEIGVDVLNPVQTLAAGMEPVGLKRDFGDRLTFNGGVDTQELLPHASAEMVRAETQRLIEVFGQNGGYILAPAHVFQADVPIDNVIAVYETALGERLV